jgi:hypothetical protein
MNLWPTRMYFKFSAGLTFAVTRIYSSIGPDLRVGLRAVTATCPVEKSTSRLSPGRARVPAGPRDRRRVSGVTSHPGRPGRHGGAGSKSPASH